MPFYFVYYNKKGIIMESDINGLSTCKPGQEQYEAYCDSRGRQLVQYDYRRIDGELFSTVAKSLEGARNKRDNWLIKKNLV